MPVLLSQFVGALIPTFALSRLLLWITKKWDGGLIRYLAAHLGSLLLAALIGGLGRADGGAFAPIEAAGVYAIPQAMWLVVDLIRFNAKSRTKLVEFEIEQSQKRQTLRPGWFRVWVVATLAIWTTGVLIGLMQETGRWELYEQRFPPFAVSRSAVCQHFGDPYSGHCARGDHAPAGYALGAYDNVYHELRSADEYYSEAAVAHWQHFGAYWLPYWLWGIAPFLLGLLMLGIGWAGRGFQR